ncbi:MAG: HPr family phosphocarrier protein [Pseudomonadota bacterium]
MSEQAAQRVVIVNQKGLHARASAKFAKLAAQYESKVSVSHEGVDAAANSIMDLLLLAAHRGCEIELHAEGPDAAQAVTALASLVADGFGELEEDAGCSPAPI